MQSHSKERKFACDYCKKEFLTKADLIRHEKREARVFKHKCEICPREFEEKAQLTDHMCTHTGEKITCVKCVTRHFGSALTGTDT